MTEIIRGQVFTDRRKFPRRGSAFVKMSWTGEKVGPNRTISSRTSGGTSPFGLTRNTTGTFSYPRRKFESVPRNPFRFGSPSNRDSTSSISYPEDERRGAPAGRAGAVPADRVDRLEELIDLHAVDHLVLHRRGGPRGGK